MLLRLTDVHQGECIGRNTGYGCRKELGMPLRGLEGCLAVDPCKCHKEDEMLYMRLEGRLGVDLCTFHWFGAGISELFNKKIQSFQPITSH